MLEFFVLLLHLNPWSKFVCLIKKNVKNSEPANHLGTMDKAETKISYPFKKKLEIKIGLFMFFHALTYTGAWWSCLDKSRLQPSFQTSKRPAKCLHWNKYVWSLSMHFLLHDSLQKFIKSCMKIVIHSTLSIMMSFTEIDINNALNPEQEVPTSVTNK